MEARQFLSLNPPVFSVQKKQLPSVEGTHPPDNQQCFGSMLVGDEDRDKGPKTGPAMTRIHA